MKEPLSEQTAERLADGISGLARSVEEVVRTCHRIAERATASAVEAALEARVVPERGKRVQAEELARHLRESLAGTREELGRVNDRRVELEAEVAELKRVALPSIRAWFFKRFRK